jgi:hypothetical protein
MFIIMHKIEKNKIPKERSKHKIVNVAGSVWLCLFVDGTGKRKLPPTQTCTGLSRIQHFIIKMVVFYSETSVVHCIMRKQMFQTDNEYSKVLQSPKSFTHAAFQLFSLFIIFKFINLLAINYTGKCKD